LLLPLASRQQHHLAKGREDTKEQSENTSEKSESEDKGRKGTNNQQLISFFGLFAFCAVLASFIK
jgi:hypothetical protein